MTTNPYEQNLDTQFVSLRPTADPADLPALGQALGEFRASTAPRVDTDNEMTTTASDFFHLPELSPLNIDGIDMSDWDDATKNAFAHLSGLGRAEAQDDATTREVAQVLSDVFVERRDARMQRDAARNWSARTIIGAQLDKNDAALKAETAQQRHERAMREKAGIEEDIHTDFEQMRLLRVERKSIAAQRDSLQTEYEGLHVRAQELASGKTSDGQGVTPLLKDEREIYIVKGQGFGELMGVEATDLTPGSRIEQLRAAAVIEKIYLTHHEAELEILRDKIRELDAQIAEIEETQNEKITRKQLIHDRLVETYTDNDLQQAMFESKSDKLEEQILIAQLIPRPPAENILEQTQRELAARLGQRAAQGIVEIPSVDSPRPIPAGQPAMEITVGGTFRNKRKVYMSLPSPRSDQ